MRPLSYSCCIWIAGLLAVPLAGCSVAADSAGPAAHTPRPAPEPAVNAALRQRLRQKLSAVEKSLETPAREQAGALLHERLVLTVALMEAEQRTDELSEATLLERADERVKRAKQRRRREQGDDDEKQQGQAGEGEHPRLGSKRASTRGLLQKLKRPEKKESEEDEANDCSPGDPLCSALPPPPPPVERSKEDRDEDGRGAPGGPGGRKAARVAPSETPRGLDRVVQQRYDRISACVPPNQRAGGIALRVRAKLDPSGRLRSPRIRGAELEPRVVACITDVIREMRVPGHSGASRVVTIPLWFGDN